MTQFRLLLFLEQAHSQQSGCQQYRAQQDCLERRNRAGRTANEVRRNQGPEIRQCRDQSNQGLESNSSARDCGNRKREPPKPQSPPDFPHDSDAEPIVRYRPGIKHRLQQPVFCVFYFLSHVDDL